MSLKDDLTSTRDKLRARMADLRSDIETIQASARPLWEEVERMNKEHSELGARRDALSAQANAMEQPHLHSKKTELAEVARTEIALNEQIKRL